MKPFKHRLFYSIPVALLGIGLSTSGSADQEFTSMQSEDVERVEIKVDIDAAAERLAGGVRFPTSSNVELDDFYG